MAFTYRPVYYSNLHHPSHRSVFLHKVGEPWVTHEWLSEVFFYALYRLGSYGLLIFTFSIIITAAFLLTYLRSPADTRPYVAGFVLLLGAISTAPTWGVRPQMISLLLASLFLLLLDRYRAEGKLKFLIPLPFIMLVWVNLHAGYFLGLVLVGIFIAGGVIDLFVAQILQKGKLSLYQPLNPSSTCALLWLFASWQPWQTRMAYSS